MRIRDVVLATFIVLATFHVIAIYPIAGTKLPICQLGSVVHASPAPKREVWRDFLQEAYRAELHIGGILVDMGTQDQHKFTRGGWSSGWGPLEKGLTLDYCTPRSETVYWDFWLRGPPQEIVLRARAPEESTVMLYLDNKSLGSLEISPRWSIHRISLAGARTGRSRVSMEVKGAMPDVDWLWLRSKKTPRKAPGVVPRLGALRFHGRANNALLAPTSRSYSFYLHLPANALLEFSFGSDQSTSYWVQVETADGKFHRLGTFQSKKGQWQNHKVSLEAFGSQAVRLEMRSEGPMGRTGWGVPRITTAPSEQPSKTANRGSKNLVLVVLDTTNANAFATTTTKSKAETPHYDEFAKKAVVFENAYNNENWTKPSTATILSGLLPWTHGARTAQDKLSPRIDLLPEHLKAKGFRTAGIVANANISDVFGFEQDWVDFDNQSRTGRGNGKDVYGDAIRWLEKHHDEGRFFLYLQSVDSHTDYNVLESYYGRYFAGPYRGKLGKTFSAKQQKDLGRGRIRANATDLAWVRALYHGEVTYQDEWLGRLLEKLESLGRLEDTVVVITNDHGEELGEGGRWGHGWTLYEAQIKAPLLIHFPKGTPARSIKEVVEHVDLAPTLVELLGLPPLPHADGRSFADLLWGQSKRRRPFYAVQSSRSRERSIRIGSHKLIVHERKQYPELFDVKANPSESKNIAREFPLIVRLAEVYLGEGLARGRLHSKHKNQKKTFDPLEADIDAETRKQLEALGYL